MERMRACNAQAGDLTGDERKGFIKGCLSTPSPPTPAQKSARSGLAAPLKEATIFGVTIGRQIDSYPSCESEEGREKICVYPPLRLPEGFENKNRNRYIELRPGKAEYLTSNFMIGTRPDGTINFVSVQTGGAKYQQRIFDMLVTRYGKPGSMKHSIVQNAFGAKFDKIEATWALAGGGLIFNGLEDRIDEGSIGLVADRP